jgi:4,5-dihydroxyphthalate decarboxylase
MGRSDQGRKYLRGLSGLAVIKKGNAMKSDIKLTFSVSDYHRTRPLLTGQVALDGIEPNFHAAAPGEACLVPVYEQFDVAEMSLSWYAMARDRGEPVYGLPIFPLRMFIHPYISVRADSEIAEPRDLVGKRVGMDRYRLTVGLWARGILQEYHGVSPEDVDWFTGEPEGAGFEPPAKLKLTMANKDSERMLLDGDVDALISPNVPASFRAGDTRIRRLFPRIRETIQDYFDKTGIFPITHTVVVREALLMKEPWIVKSLVDGFEAANRICDTEYNYPKRLSFPTAPLILEEEEERFGKNPWQHGLEANKHNLETFMGYAAAQNYTARRLSLGESFWAENTARPNLVAAE